MGRPNYDDVIAGGDNEPEPNQGETTGWLQHGGTPDGIEYRGG